MTGTVPESATVLALETSCDETAVAVVTTGGEILASCISSQIELHRPYGGVVPELASRNHVVAVRLLIEKALSDAGISLKSINAFGATAGPGLASSLLIGNTVAKSLAISLNRPFIAVNHLEGHLLSPFMGNGIGPVPSVGLVVSGGHTLLIHLKGAGDYQFLGKTRDDAAGEAFDKVAKMLGLPYPGGPEIDRHALAGKPAAFNFPRSMLREKGFEFSFSGLKTSVLYQLEKLDGSVEENLDDLCASFQEAVVEVLVGKTIRAARSVGETTIGVSGGVSCNRRLRAVFTEACADEGLTLCLADSAMSTDNAAMIGYVAARRLEAGLVSDVSEDIDPNLPLVSGGERHG